MLKGKKLIDYNNLSSPNNFKNNDDIILKYFKNGWNSIQAPNIDPNLNDQQFILNRINETKYDFIAKIKERELMSEKLIKYIASFDYSECLIV